MWKQLLGLAGSTQDRNVFSFYPDQRPSNGFNEVLSRYRELVPHVRLAGMLIFKMVALLHIEHYTLPIN